jgi:hypothetical protein
MDRARKPVVFDPSEARVEAAEAVSTANEQDNDLTTK